MNFKASRSLTRILMAVDDSDQSQRALSYVGSLVRDTRGIEITLFHVLKPLPRVLLEHGGSENPRVEDVLRQQLRAEQEEWVGHEDDIAQNILDEARAGAYETIVVSRHGGSAIKKLFGGGITDHLLGEASGFTLWMVG